VLVLVDAGESASSEQLNLHSLHTSHVIMFSIRAVTPLLLCFMLKTHMFSVFLQLFTAGSTLQTCWPFLVCR